MNYGNVIVGQSGGPTAVINSSLAGVFKTARDRGAGKVFGMLNGVEGLLDRRVVDMEDIITTDLQIELLKRTPSSYLGSCRYKLPEIGENDELYNKLFDILREYDIKHFFYIGGNDSMDTIAKLSAYGKLINSDIHFMGVPKTIDNDLAKTDHTPGYGSAAQFICTIMKEISKDAAVYNKPNVHIVEIMGRNAGWLTASSALSRGEDCSGPDLIYLPETVFDISKFLADIERVRKDRKSVIVAVSEGVRFADGRYVCEGNDSIKPVDAFGHTMLGGTAASLANITARELGIKTKPIELGILQRCSSHIVSRVDITEAFVAGGHAVEASFMGETGKMMIINRVTNEPYQCTTAPFDINKIANIEKKVPDEWITENGTYVSKEFLTYARPLIQAELTPIMVDGLPCHIH